jgi:phototropin
MTQSIDQVLQNSPSSGSYQHSRPRIKRSRKQSPPNLRQTNVAMGTRSNAQSVYGGQSSSNHNMYESSTSTLDGNTVGSQRFQNDMFAASNPNRGGMDGFTDFFSREVFQLVLHNPTTAHRFLKFCQARSCAENIEFLQKVRRSDSITLFIRNRLGLVRL